MTDETQNDPVATVAPVAAPATLPTVSTSPNPPGSASSEAGAIDGATRQALSVHSAEQPIKRGRGRPPGSKGRVKVENEVSSVGGPAPEDQSPPGPPMVPAAPLLDEETIALLIDGATEMFDELQSGLCSLLVAQKTKNEKATQLALEKCKWSETTKKLIRLGGKGCAKKYMQQFQYAPETALALGFALGLGGSATKALAIIKDPPK